MGKAIGPFRGRQNVEEEIDLREYVEVIVRRWRWIAGITLAAVVTAAVISFFVITPVYEATGTILVPPQESGSPPYSLQIANASIEAQVVEHLGSFLPTEDRVPGRLLHLVSVSHDAEQNLVRITVQANNPEKAAQVVNAWAEASVQTIAQDQKDKQQDIISEKEKQAQIAAQNLEEAEEALRVLEAEILELNALISSLQEDLQATQEMRQAYQREKSTLLLRVRELAALRQAVQRGQIRLSIDFLSLWAGVQPSRVILQTSPPSVAPGPTPDAESILDSLILTSEAREQLLSSNIEELSSTIEQLAGELLRQQQQLAEKQGKLAQLNRERDVAQELYTPLAKDIAVAELTKQVGVTSGIETKVINPATPPVAPVQPRRKLNIAIAGVLGLMVGVFGAFAVEYFEGWGKEGKEGN